MVIYRTCCVQELEKGLDELEASYRAEGLHNAASGSSTESAAAAAPSSSNGGADCQGSNGEAGKSKASTKGKARSNSKRPRSHADTAGVSLHAFRHAGRRNPQTQL